MNPCVIHLGYDLQARVNAFNVSTSVIGFTWGNSSRDDDLVTSYRVELKEYRTGKLIANVSVGTNRSFYVNSCFIPGNRYVFTIISTVVLSDPSETILVRADKYCIVGKYDLYQALRFFFFVFFKIKFYSHGIL